MSITFQEHPCYSPPSVTLITLASPQFEDANLLNFSNLTYALPSHAYTLSHLVPSSHPSSRLISSISIGISSELSQASQLNHALLLC